MNRMVLVAALLFLHHIVVAQDFAIDYTPAEVLLNNFYEVTKADAFAPLKDITDPKVADLEAVGTRALQKAEELKKLRKRLDTRLVDLLTNDVGRWIAADENAVRVFLGFDLNNIAASDASIDSRITRIAKASKALTTHVGPFTMADNRLAKLLLLDAIWIETTHLDITSRLNLVLDYERKFKQQKPVDLSKLPTLGEAKQASVGKLMGLIFGAQVEGKQGAQESSVELYRDQAYSAEMSKLRQDIKGKSELAKLTVKFIEAEYDVKVAEQQRRVQQKKNEELRVKQKTLLEKEDEEKLRLHAYLKSPAVLKLLAPFASDGRTTPRYHRNRHPLFDQDQLKPGPMSYKLLHKEVFASSLGKARQLDYLTAVANDPGNDRPAAWGIGNTAWRQAPSDFRDMDGQAVNRYVEAYEILTNHGTTLVQLGILRP